MINKHKKAGSSRITLALREMMFDAFSELGTVRATSKRCGVHIKTAKKYRIRDNWDERIKGIEVRVNRQLDIKIENRRLRNVKVLDLAIEDVVQQLLKSREENNFGTIDPKILPRLVVAQDHLLGRGAADDEHSTIPVEATEALEYLATLPANTIAQLADVLAEKLTPEGNPARKVEKTPTLTKLI